MSDDSPVVATSDLTDAMRDVIAQVLMVPLASVRLESALVADLGAESIDFLDLVFRIEETLARKIPARRWEEFIDERLPGEYLSRAITTAIVIEFAERERARA